ncbi:MAG: phosphotransferase, partial [Planctomycetes bacterium]|nr:phosphotransferase [Planctomycetota bacterium]
FLPGLVSYEDNPPLLVLELLRQAKPLWQQFRAGEERAFLLRVSHALGSALGTIHHTFQNPALVQGPHLGWLPRQVPGALEIHKPGPEVLATLSSANWQTLHILQTHEHLSERLDGLRRLWQPETVIHNDLRADNVFVLPGLGGTTGPVEIRILDWEFVQFGDPAWDVAGVLQDFIHGWIHSMDLTGSLDFEALEKSAYCSRQELQEAIRLFWQGYRTVAERRAAETERLLDRAVAFSAARLIQTAYELGQFLNTIARESVLLLQVGANILGNPEAAQVHLYGIPQEFTSGHSTCSSRPVGDN